MNTSTTLQASATQHQTDFAMVQASMDFLAKHWQDQPSLAELASLSGLSAEHFQRRFRQYAGVSPKQFLAALTLPKVLHALQTGKSVLDSSFDAGFGSPSRGHELVVKSLGLTPNQVKRQAKGVLIRYALLPCNLGYGFIACTALGLCCLAFVDDDSDQTLQAQMSRFPEALWQADEAALRPLLEQILQGHRPALDIYGTGFQMQVWAALLTLPTASLVSYADLARALGKPKASRAVGGAVGANPIAMLIPCHRVIQTSGALGGYRWGLARKVTLLGHELATVP